MTGTPLDLTPFGPLLSALGWLYWAVAIGLAGLALWWPRSWWVKLPLAAVVIAAFVLPVARHVVQQDVQQADAQKKLDASMALFNERCKTAGEKINRTVENVEGVVWMKWREPTSNADNFADQWKLNDPYGHDCGAEDCIGLSLRVTSGAELNPEEAKRHATGYRFVETTDPRDGERYRYRAVIKSIRTRTPEQRVEYQRNTRGPDPGPNVYGFGLDREPIAKFSFPYGITWDDISTREDREHWIAASSLRVVDLSTNELIAERIGYMIDRGQGSQEGFRSPWLYAEYTACPAFDRSESNSPIKTSRSRAFVFKVLKTNQEN